MSSPTTEQSRSQVTECACASPRTKWVPGPPKLLLMAITTMVLLHLFLPGASFQAPTWWLLGLLLLAAGIALNLLADRAFKRVGTTVKPLLASTTLVTDGVFGLTRNPMYVGFVFLLVGLWLMVGSVAPGLVVAVFAVLIDRYFVRPEEEKLALTFGDVYAAYRCQVRRWV